MAAYGIIVHQPFSFNTFMDYDISQDGLITYKETLSKPGDYIDLKAEVDVIVAISNCPQELSVVNGFEPTKLRVAVFEQEQYLRIEPDAQMEALLVDSSFAVERPA